MFVSGCSDGAGRAGTLPSRTATPTTTSASPTPTPTTPEAQIEAAVRAFYAEITRAAATNDPSRLSTMTTDGCPCAVYARGIAKFKKEGKRAVGARWTVKSVRVREVTSEVGQAEVVYVVSAYTVLNSRGELVERFPARQFHLDVSLIKEEHSWIIGNTFGLKG